MPLEASDTSLNVDRAPPRANMQWLLFVDEPGGTGKMFVTSVLERYIKPNGLKLLTVASSTLADQLLNGSRAAHSALKILVPVHHQSMFSIDVKTVLADELCRTTFFIWEKIMKAHRKNLDAVYRTFRDLM